MSCLLHGLQGQRLWSPCRTSVYSEGRTEVRAHTSSIAAAYLHNSCRLVRKGRAGWSSGKSSRCREGIDWRFTCFDKDVGHVQEELCMPLDCRESWCTYVTRVGAQKLSDISSLVSVQFKLWASRNTTGTEDIIWQQIQKQTVMEGYVFAAFLLADPAFSGCLWLTLGVLFFLLSFLHVVAGSLCTCVWFWPHSDYPHETLWELDRSHECMWPGLFFFSANGGFMLSCWSICLVFAFPLCTSLRS